MKSLKSSKGNPAIRAGLVVAMIAALAVVLVPTTALAAGAVRETMGGTLSTLKTVTVTGADVARLPDESRAVAVTVC